MDILEKSRKVKLEVKKRKENREKEGLDRLER